MESIEAGTLAGIGSFRCDSCGFLVNLSGDDALPTCPGCGGEEYSRASLFSGAQPEPRPWPSDEPENDSWLDELREELTEPGQYVVYHAPGEDRAICLALSSEWTRIGRSLAADIRFDDPTVSRRHALIIRQPDGVRVLDDRSLNGVFVNGEPVEWSVLGDGDEILVGCHSLRFLDVVAVKGSAEPNAGSRSRITA